MTYNQNILIFFMNLQLFHEKILKKIIHEDENITQLS